MDAPRLRTLLRAAAHALLARIYRQGSTPAPGKEVVHADGLRVTISLEPDPREHLTKIQRAAFDVLTDEGQKASELMEEAGYEDAQYFAEALRALVRCGLAIKGGVDSYRRN